MAPDPAKESNHVTLAPNTIALVIDHWSADSLIVITQDLTTVVLYDADAITITGPAQ